MLERIKIYISEEINRVILEDIESFGFIKSTKEPNRNGFLNILINNYIDIYDGESDNDEEQVKKIIKEKALKITSDCLLEAANQISSYFKRIDNTNLKSNVTFSFKPTNALNNEKALSMLSRDINHSGYLRNMLASYVSLSRSKREQIIFKQKYEIINNAIKNHKYLEVTHKKRSIGKVLPYAIVSGKEELYNYVLVEKSNGTTDSFRLSHVNTVYTINEIGSFKKESLKLFQEALDKGPQFLSAEKIEIVVKLTDNGKKLFKNAYVHRPVPTKIEDDLYYFNWSKMQILFYFKRFGKDAIVISPKECKDEMINFYKEALESYK